MAWVLLGLLVWADRVVVLVLVHLGLLEEEEALILACHDGVAVLVYLRWTGQVL